MTTKYQNSKVYKLINEINKIVYIGSTTQLLRQRMGEHRYHAGFNKSVLYQSMRDLGATNFRIELISEFPCTNLTELQNEEFRVMQELAAEGISLYNMRVARTGFVFSDESRAKMSVSRKNSVLAQAALARADRNRVCYGSLYYTPAHSVWTYRWMVDGKRLSRSYSDKKWGVEAKQKLEVLRLEIYPDYVGV